MNKRIGYVAVAAGAMLLLTVWAALRAEPQPPIIWLDADALAYADANGEHYGKVRITMPGMMGTPVPLTEPTSPTTGLIVSTCPQSQNGLKDGTQRWRCRCLFSEGHPQGCYLSWIMPPPTVPCTRDVTPKCQFGYCCAEGIDGIAGWQGAWKGAVRP